MTRNNLLIAACAAALFGAAAGANAAAPLVPPPTEPPGPTRIALLERSAGHFERNLQVGALRIRYADLLADARELETAPARSLLAERAATESELRDGIQSLRDRIAAAKEAEAESAVPSDAVSAGAVAGVPMSTLEAIAACESGGDPTAVNPAGYYGKYQFDMGTWASVGGSGNPAEAPESEQDYRAALLYSQAGASPWPVCGA